MLKKLIIILPLLLLTACHDDDEQLKEYKNLAKLIRYGEVEDDVILELTDMKYACGECLRLYQVDKVLYSEMNQYNFYLNKELSVLFLNTTLKNQWNTFFVKMKISANVILLKESIDEMIWETVG